MASGKQIDVREAIMKVACTTVQMHGYNALSFRDLGEAVGVKSSSVHHYFPTKADLAEALASRYADDFEVMLDGLLKDEPEHDELMKAYAAIYREGLADNNRICLIGMMNAEISSLPQPVRAQIERFAGVHVKWLTKVLKYRHPRATPATLKAKATAIYAALQGAQIVSHGFGGDTKLFDKMIDAYIASDLFS
jgi:TetR/AcrR family transcriptional regulator, transcriptional repressor for nem operon